MFDIDTSSKSCFSQLLGATIKGIELLMGQAHLCLLPLASCLARSAISVSGRFLLSAE